MPHRKEEYDANGHEVTIMQVNEGGETHAWIDGWAAHIHEAIESFPNSDLEVDLAEKIQHHIDNDESWTAIKSALAWMCDNHVYFCNECQKFYDYNNVVGKHYAGHMCPDCHEAQRICPESPEFGPHEDRCLNPRDKHNARVPTKYKCEHCGRVRETTVTG